METPLAQQSSETVFENEQQIIAFVQAAFPTLDLSPGTALRDLVIRIYAHLEVRIQEQIDLALISSSLLEISKNPNSVDDVQLERLLSNYNVSRSDGSTATGKVRVFLNAPIGQIVPNTAVFTLGGHQYTPAIPVILSTPQTFTGAANQRLIEQSGSVYTAVIDVVATAPGAEYNVRNGTLVASVTPSLTSYISGKADADFSGGVDGDDNVALLEKAQAGIVGKLLSGRDHIKAKLMTEFPGVKDVGAAGFLDPEMTRDLINNVNVGGRVDLYVKSSAYPSRLQEQMKAWFVSYDPDIRYGIFETYISRSKGAGLYTVDSVRSLVSQLGSFELVSDVRFMEGNSIHLTNNITDVVYSSYQGLRIRFKVPFANILEAGTAVPNFPTSWDGSIEPVGRTWYNNPAIAEFLFFVEYLKMPNMVELQDYIDSAGQRSLTTDMLVKAPVPALCSLQMRLLKPAGAPDIDLAALRSALSSKFNSYGMGESIPASALIHTAYMNIPAGYTVDLPVHMYAVMIRPDQTKDVMFSSDALRPPRKPAEGLSGNTVAFFLDSSMVDVSVVSCE
jgi:hypothetical protein